MILSAVVPLNIYFKSLKGQDLLLNHENDGFQTLSAHGKNAVGLVSESHGVNIRIITVNREISQGKQIIATRSGLGLMSTKNGTPVHWLRVFDIEEKCPTVCDFSVFAFQLCRIVDALVDFWDERRFQIPSLMHAVLRYAMHAKRNVS